MQTLRFFMFVCLGVLLFFKIFKVNSIYIYTLLISTYQLAVSIVNEQTNYLESLLHTVANIELIR